MVPIVKLQGFLKHSKETAIAPSRLLYKPALL